MFYGANIIILSVEIWTRSVCQLSALAAILVLLRKVIVCSNSTKLGKGAFCECRGLVSVELPEGLQVIEEGLFYGCESLRGIAIPSSLTKIGVDAFNECHGLASVELPNGLLELGMYSFYKCYSLETLHVPATVSSIGTFAFSGCMGLKHIKLPPTLKRIESYMFYQCLELEYIDIPWTVSFIGEYAFYDCSSLSHIRIPPDVEHIDFNTFLGCSSLISLEVPEGIMIGIDEDEVDSDEEEEEHEGVIDLVNLAVPTLPEDDERLSGWLHSKLLELGSVVRNGVDVSRKLKHRFDHSPLNKLCYYQSYHSSEDIMLQLRSLMEDDPLAATCQVDEFGMTPLHVLSLSQTPNIDMLLTVLNGGHLDHVIRRRDSFGSTPMDYLCLNQMPESAEVIRRVLQTRFDHMLSLDRSWKSDVVEAVNEALAVDPFSRMRVVIAVYLKLANYERKEVISVLELYLWKTKIDEVGSKEEMCDREGCRINSGASIVIPHVLPFLGKLDMEEYFVCSQD
eukprot:scaffold2747_cov104-Cylindrotheca_fusiformis.AAC.1